MNWMEIVLLLLGVGAFAVSFVLPEKKSDEAVVDDELVHSLIEKELADTKTRVVEVVDETLDYAVEKTERAAERISNEKIMAISDYSETVLSDMNKTHQEIMFLYDMLNDKHKNLKETAIKVDKTAKEAEEKAQAAASVMEPAQPKSNVVPMTPPEPDQPKTQPEFRVIEPPKTIVPLTANVQPVTQPASNVQPIAQPTSKVQPVKLPAAKETPTIKEFSFAEQAPHIERSAVKELQAARMENKVSMMKAPQPEEPQAPTQENNNDRILRLHKEGKSTVDIARELGLGVGEVKLVINLFKGA